MPDKRSPVAGVLAGIGTAGPGRDDALAIADRDPGSLMQFAGWRDFAAAMLPAFDVLGFTQLGDFRAVQRAGRAFGYRTAPNRLLVRHEDPGVLAQAAHHVDGSAVAALDLSHARWIVAIEGAAAPAVMSRLAAIDFDAAAFPPASFVQTGIDHVAVLVHRLRVDAFEIVVPYTWAASLADLVLETTHTMGCPLARPADAAGR